MKKISHTLFIFLLLVSIVEANQNIITGDTVFPTSSAQWNFALTPYLHLETIYNDSNKLPIENIGITLYDEKSKSFIDLTNAVIEGDDTLYDSKRIIDNIEIIQSIEALSPDNNAIIWTLEIRNKSTVERWLEAGLSGSINSQNQLKYWDGYSLVENINQKLERTSPQLAFPATMLKNSIDTNAVVIAMHPENNISWMRNYLDPVEGKYFYGGRFVIPENEKIIFKFVLYTLKPCYEELDAIDGYYQRFPNSFEAKTNTDPRLTKFQGINSAYEARYGMGVNATVNDTLNANLGKLHVTWDWGYNSFKFVGDWYGSQENWDLSLTEQSSLLMQEYQDTKSTFDLYNIENFYNDRKALYLNSDTINVTQAFFMLNFAQTELVEKNNWMPYTYGYFDYDEHDSGFLTGWVQPYDNTWHIFPWATPFENTFRNDIPNILNDLETSSLAVDVFADSAPYRGATDYYLQGWSYDEKGKYIDTAIANKHLLEYLHTLSGDYFDVGVVVNLSPWEKDPALYIENESLSIPNYAAIFQPDAYIVEGDASNLIDYDKQNRLFPKRYLFGKKYISSVSGANADKIGERIPWNLMSANQIRKVFKKYLDKRLMAYYQGGILPNYSDARGIDLFVNEIPRLLEVQSRGFTASPASFGNALLERRRYGNTLGAAIVYSNPTSNNIEENEYVNNQYFSSDANVITVPFNIDESTTEFSFENSSLTKIKLNVESMKNVILLFPIVLSGSNSDTLSGTTNIVQKADQQDYIINLYSSINQNISLKIEHPRSFEVGSIQLDNIDIPISNNISINLHSGNNVIRVSFFSDIFLSPEEDYLNFDWSNYEIKIIGVQSNKKISAAEILTTYSHSYLNFTPSIVDENTSSTLPTVVIQTDPSLRGVFIDSNNPNLLIISGATEFDTQQLAWYLARLLDSKKTQKARASFTNQSTKDMLDRIGVMYDAQNSASAFLITDQLLQPVSGDDLLPGGIAPNPALEDYDFPIVYPLDRQDWIATASGNYVDTGNPIAPGKMLDGISGTRWTAGKGKAGSWIIVDMKRRYQFSHIRMVSPYPYLYYPLHYKVEVSDNGTTWRNTIYGEGNSKDTDAYWQEMQQARYIRVTLLEDQSAFWSIDEFCVFGDTLPSSDQGTTIDISLVYPLSRKNWVATASGNYVDTGNPIAPEKMLDGISGTRWTAGKGKANSWVIMDMGMRQEFNHIRMVSPYPYLYYPLHYKVEVSDNGTTWRNAIYGEGSSKDTDAYWQEMQQARYIRVTLMKDQSTFWSIDEFYIFRRTYLSPELSSPYYPFDRQNWVATASGNYVDTGNPIAPEKMLDGISGTRWTAGKGKADSWVIVDMGMNQEFNHIQMVSPYPYLYYPLHYKVEVSDDGTTWRNAIYGEGSSKDTDAYWQEMQQARYIRVTLMEDQSTFWSIDEFYVFGKP